MGKHRNGKANAPGSAPEPERPRAWFSFGPLPLDGRLPGTESDPEWQAQFEARFAPWRASMARGEPAAALVAGPLPHGADALVIRDPNAPEPRLLVLSEAACTFAHITRGRHGLTQSEMRTLDVPRRVEIALWLDGRVRVEDAEGRVRTWTERWRYVGGDQPEREREFLARFDGAPPVELPGLGVVRMAPSYRYPRVVGPSPSSQA